MKLDKFLKTYVTGYLLSDLRTMEELQLPRGRRSGALGYPIVMTVAAGIELLGALGSPPPVSDSQGIQHFRLFWQRWLYPDPARQRLADAVYLLGRHGIAHAFAAKPRITVTRLKSPKSHHLQIDPKTADTLVIDAPTLIRDFRRAYKRWRAELAANPTFKAQCEGRLNQIEADAQRQSANHTKILRKTPRAGMPLPAQRVAGNVHINVNSPTANPTVSSQVNLSSKGMKP